MVKLNKIYTRTGDAGTTGLVSGARVSKHCPRMEAIGTVDEANSAIGVAGVALAAGAYDAGHLAALARIQNDMFDLGADLATPGEDFTPSPRELRVVPEQVTWLEHAIDVANQHLEPLTSFILPGGSQAGALVHVARTIARRAERTMVALAEAEPVNPAALAYINRLSDYLFVLSRAVNADGAGDVLWVPGASRDG
jgi:cob(I)alamin adenosyltransferase